MTLKCVRFLEKKIENVIHDNSGFNFYSLFLTSTNSTTSMDYQKAFKRKFTGIGLMIISNFIFMNNAFSQEVIVLPTIEMNSFVDNEISVAPLENQVTPLVLASQKIKPISINDGELKQKFATSLKIITTPHYSLTLSYNGLMLRNNGTDINLSETLHLPDISDFVALNGLIYILSNEHLYSFDPVKMEFAQALSDEKISTIFTKDIFVIATASDQTFSINSTDGSISTFSESKVEQLVTAQNGNVLAIENDGKGRQLVSYYELNCSGFNRQVVQVLDPIATVNLAYVESSDNFILASENVVYQSSSENISWDLLIQSDSKIVSISVVNGTVQLNLINSSIVTVFNDGSLTIQAKIESDLPAQIQKNKAPKLVMDLDRSQSHKKIFSPLLLGINPEYSHTVFDVQIVNCTNENLHRNQLKWSPIIGSLYDEHFEFLLPDFPPALAYPTYLFPNTNTIGILIAFTERDLFSNFRVKTLKSGILT